MQCSERERLWEIYTRALDAFYIAASHLYKLHRALSTAEFHELDEQFGVCEEANGACKTAKSNWERHLKEHSCK